jgi:hypothetical protein
MSISLQWESLPGALELNFEEKIRNVWDNWKDNGGSLEAAVKILQETIIYAAEGIEYAKTDYAAILLIVGMSEGEKALDKSLGDVYRYESSTWTWMYNLVDQSGVIKYLVPSEAEFEANAAAVRCTSNGSGFVEMGNHHSTVASYPNVNQGIYALNTAGYENEFQLGNKNSPTGVSRTNFPILHTHGYKFNIDKLNTVGTNESARILCPPASNSSALPDRQDLAGFEVFHEEMTGSGNKNALFPNGITQYGVSTFEGITLTTSAFTGQDTYSLFGNWQSAGDTEGYCIDWDTTTIADKLTFLKYSTNVYHNKAGNLCQVLVRARSVAGLGETWGNTESNESSDVKLQYSASNVLIIKGNQVTISNDLDTGTTEYFNSYGGAGSLAVYPDKGLGLFYGVKNATTQSDNAYEGRVFFYPIALITRLNQGAYHPIYNPLGTAKCSNSSTGAEIYWYEDGVTIASTADCFDDTNGHREPGTGAIGENSGHPLGEFYDQVIERGFKDLRNYTSKPGLDRVLDKGMLDILGNIHRGWEGIWKTSIIANPTYSGKGASALYGSTTSTWVSFNSDIFGRGDIYLGGTNYITDILFLYIEGDSGKYYYCIDARTYGSGTASAVYLHPWYGDATADFSSGTYKVLLMERQTTKFKDHCRTEILGDPFSTDYPAAGIYAVPNLVDMSDNTKDTTTADSQLPTHRTTGATHANCKDFCLQKKITDYTDIVAVLVSDDPAASGYTAFSYNATPTADNKWGFNANTNEIHINFSASTATGLGYADAADMIAQCHILVQYKADGNKYEIAPNSAFLKIGNIEKYNYRGSATFHTDKFTTDLISKILTANTSPSMRQGDHAFNYVKDPLTGKLDTSNDIEHWSSDLSTTPGDLPAGKVCPLLKSSNNRASINITFKEMRCTSSVWRDDDLFQIIDNVKSIGDDASNPVIYGQVELVCPLQYLIQDKE